MAQRSRKSRRRGGAQGFSWMLVGLGLGLVVAAGVYFSGWRFDAGARRSSADPPAASTAPAASPALPATTPRTSRGSSGAAEASRTNRADGPAARGAGVETESRFDFYEILPQYEVVVPEVETVTAPSTPPASVSTPGRYILQTGSFRSHGDADRMQASLALLGIESRIQRVEIDDDVYHRVRVGPISDLDQLNRLRAQLRGAGVEALMMKVND